jgi:hypothetical protein
MMPIGSPSSASYDARSGPDRNGERQASGNRQARVFEQHPDTELVILQHVPSWRPSMASRVVAAPSHSIPSLVSIT